MCTYLIHDPGGQFVLGIIQVIQAGRCCDDEAGRHIDTDLGHFAQVGTLATEQHFVAAIAIFKCVDVFLLIAH